MKKSWRAFLVCVGMIGFYEAFAQQGKPFENLSIDRPDVSNLPTTVLPGHFQFEIGSEWSFSAPVHETNIPNVVFRTGLNKRSELRLGFSHLALDSVNIARKEYILFFSLSGKYRFFDERGWRPSMAIQPEFNMPFGSSNYIHKDHPDYSQADYSLLFLFNNTLHHQVFLNYNAGFFWSRDDQLDYLLSASASFLHTHRLGYFLELYTLIENGAAPLSFDGGIMFLISPRFQVDIYGGHRTLDGERYWFGGAGVGFRIDRGDLVRRTFKEMGVHH